jgi:hypothetical protein
MSHGLVIAYNIIYLFLNAYVGTTVTRSPMLQFHKPKTTFGSLLVVTFAMHPVSNTPIVNIYLNLKAGLINPLGASALVARMLLPNQVISPL